MNKIYLVIIDLFQSEENSIINICSTRKKAEQLMSQYENNANDNKYRDIAYHIDEVDLNSSEDILWDCYRNSSFNTHE